MNTWFRGNDEGEEDSPASRNPVVDDPNYPGLEISKVSFEELIKVFPNTSQVGRFYATVSTSYLTFAFAV